MKKYILSLVLGLVSYFGFAQDGEKTLLWKVTPPDGKSSSYIFGTYHILCAEGYELTSKVKDALANSDEVAVEINFNDPQEMSAMQTALVSNDPIIKKFTEKEREEFSDGIKQYGYEMGQMEKLSTMAIYSMLTMRLFECSPQEFKMLDMDILQIAKNEKKKVTALETVSEQSEIFKNLLKPADLIYVAKNFEEMKNATSKSQEIYINEDLSGIEALFAEGAMHMTQEQTTVLLDKRNKAWLKKLPSIMRGKKLFVAVGAGHLPGKMGILNLLREQGYRVEPVYN